MPKYYEIRVVGQFDIPWSDWFSGFAVTPLEGDETLLSGVLADQAALFGLLKRIRDLNLTLISVSSSSPAKYLREKGKDNEED